MGRFLPDARGPAAKGVDARGRIAVIGGSLGLRDHVERLYGFQQVMAEAFSHLEVLPFVAARDDHRLVEAEVKALLAQHQDLAGLYSLGAGNRGAVRALEAARRDLVFIAPAN